MKLKHIIEIEQLAIERGIHAGKMFEIICIEYLKTKAKEMRVLHDKV